ncbi:MAG: TonB-dependent receptor [Longimicrobiales bacterium]
MDAGLGSRRRVMGRRVVPSSTPILMLARALLPLALVLTLPPGRLFSQVPVQAPTIVGRVTGPAGQPVEDVVVRVEGTSMQALTDAQGFYSLGRVTPGPHTLVTEHLGYATARVGLTVPATGEVRRDIALAVRALQVEGLTVTADAVSRARGEAATATVIARDAILQQTASSLAGVLELLPGVEMAPPGLSSVQQLSLRTAPTSGVAGSRGSADLASFGTLIIVDGVPLSNNANLQSLRSGSDLSFSTSAGGGIDLRQIPAATLERVEVIRGVPSARYGDLTQGAILVETRVGAFEPEVRTQYDPYTFEATALGGWNLGSTQGAALNIDFARTRSMPGITDDHANRLAGQFAHRFSRGASSEHGGVPGLTLDSRVDFYRLSEDLPVNENTRPGWASRNRESGLRISERARMQLPGSGTLSVTGAVTRLWQRAWSAARLTRVAMPFTDRLTPGRSMGWFVGGPYDSELTVEGAPWLVYARAEADREASGPGGLHYFRAGLELRREWNSGAGYQFDMAAPPQVSFNGVQGYDRPRGFAAVPGLATSALYLDDRIVGSLTDRTAFTLQLGLRVDGLHEPGAWLPRLRDAVLQPRLWGELSPRPWLRIRGGWGLTAKAPSLGDMTPAPQYNDVINVNWYANQPDERLAVLTTYVTDPTNPDLGLSTASKAEAGVEVEGWGSVVSLAAFRDRIRGGVGSLQETTSVLREYFQLTDSVNGNGVPPVLIEPAYAADTVPILVERQANFLFVETKGIELTATLAEIPRIRTRLQVQGSWLRTERRFTEAYFGSSMRFSEFQLLPVKTRVPYWDGVTETGERQLVTYRLIHHQPALGLVVTATIQHNLKDMLDDGASRDTLSFAGYVTRSGELVPVPASERGNAEYRDLRIARGGLLETSSTPADWMMALQVSKTLPLEGELRFWAFNALDRRGRYGGATERPRLYPQVRFGVELRVVPRVLVGETP